MKWITREHVKVDRVAYPWLIKKFIDADAEFIFVPADKVIDEAKAARRHSLRCEERRIGSPWQGMLIRGDLEKIQSQRGILCACCFRPSISTFKCPAAVAPLLSGCLATAID